MRRRQVLQMTIAGAAASWCLARGQGSTPLRIGLTSVILADLAAFLARWADYLGDRLHSRVSFATRDEYRVLHEMLANGQIDALWTCGYPYVRYQSQLRLLAVPLYHGRPTYQSYLIRHQGDATIQGWRDLRGKVFAYSDPLSNSGWLVAQGQLAAAGLGAGDFRRSFFAHGHRNVAEAVAARLAQAGSIDGYVWETMRLQRMPAALQTEVVWKSPFHGFPPIVSTVGDQRESLERLQRALIAMGDDVAGRDLLKTLNLDGFIVGTPAIFDSIRQLARSVPASGVAG